jgi:glutathione synthase/RimK-type ligase-like ATP-grasp enzyme
LIYLKFLGWKHNLGKGAKPVIVEENKLKKTLGNLALKASNAININFASVDIVETNNGMLVMEINSGVMTENFAQVNKEHYNIAKNIYKNALITMLDL